MVNVNQIHQGDTVTVRLVAADRWHTPERDMVRCYAKLQPTDVVGALVYVPLEDIVSHTPKPRREPKVGDIVEHKTTGRWIVELIRWPTWVGSKSVSDLTVFPSFEDCEVI